jgi:cell wall assembly regulator SMI1
MAHLDDAWTRVSRWLDTHAPRTAATLWPPADRSAIDAVAALVGGDLDDDVRAWLARHDGTDPDSPDRFTLPTTYAPLGTEGIATEHATLAEILDEQDDDPAGIWWDRAFLPYALSIGADSLVVDHRPGPARGRLGTFVHDHRTAFGLAPSLGAYLGAVADALESGMPIGRRRAVLVDGGLRWQPVGARPDRAALDARFAREPGGSATGDVAIAGASGDVGTN